MVTAPFCSPLHIVGVPLVESNNATVTTTFVPAACAARMKPGAGPFASIHVCHADMPLYRLLRTTSRQCRQQGYQCQDQNEHVIPQRLVRHSRWARAL